MYNLICLYFKVYITENVIRVIGSPQNQIMTALYDYRVVRTALCGGNSKYLLSVKKIEHKFEIIKIKLSTCFGLGPYSIEWFEFITIILTSLCASIVNNCIGLIATPPIGGTAWAQI